MKAANSNKSISNKKKSSHKKKTGNVLRAGGNKNEKGQASAKSRTDGKPANQQRSNSVAQASNSHGGIDVRQVQNRLNAKGYGPLEVDGVYGPKTEAAVKRFQKAMGMAVDGIVGPKTLAALEEGGRTMSPQAGNLKNVPESALVGLLPAIQDYTYDRHDGRYPFKIPGIPDSLVGPPNANNCCTFVEALLVRAWLDTHGDAFVWTSRNHRQMMIMEAGDLFSPITAVVETGMGVEQSNKEDLPQPWTAVQGWRSIDPPNGGHTFLILDSHKPTTRILTLESNKAYDMDGPGYRKVGDLDNLSNQHPGSDWFTKDVVWTWQKFLETYKHMKLAKLNVEDVNWVAAGGR